MRKRWWMLTLLEVPIKAQLIFILVLILIPASIVIGIPRLLASNKALIDYLLFPSISLSILGLIVLYRSIVLKDCETNLGENKND